MQVGGTPGEVNFPLIDTTPKESIAIAAFDQWRYDDSGAVPDAAWRDAVTDWMAEPRRGVAYTGLYPQA